MLYFHNLDQIGSGDPDGDGYSNEAEETAGTDPTNPASNPGDTDADGLPDAWEIANFGSITAQNGSGVMGNDLDRIILSEPVLSGPADACPLHGEVGILPLVRARPADFPNHERAPEREGEGAANILAL